MFGRAPFAFYVAHLYLIHALAVVFGIIQGFDAREFLTYSFFFPKGYGVGLPGVYAVWLLVVAALYPLCRWVAAAKSATSGLVAELSLGLGPAILQTGWNQCVKAWSTTFTPVAYPRGENRSKNSALSPSRSQLSATSVLWVMTAIRWPFWF